MKPDISKYLLMALTIIFFSHGIKAQPIPVKDGFSIRISPGIISFHGDLSGNTFNPVEILKENSKFGFSISALKEFNRFIGVQGQYTAGNLYGTNAELNQYFSGSISEFNISTRFTPFGLLPKIKNKFNLQPYATLGLGTLGYRSCARYIDTDEVRIPCYGFENDGTTKTAKKHGLTMPFGIGLSVPLNKNFAIDINHTWRITNTDLLDASIINSNSNDWFSSTSIGFRFTINAPEIPKQIPTKITQAPIIDPNDKLKDRKENIIPPLNIFIESLMDDVVTSGEALAVNLRINKGSYTGPAKLIQRFPSGFNVLESSSTNGKLSFENRNVLIEWDNMPTDSMVAYTYYMRVGGELAGSQTITGRLEYEDEDKWNTVRFNNYIFVDNKIGNPDDQKVLDNSVNDEKLQELKENQNKEIKEAELKAEQTVNPVKDPFLNKEPKADIEFRIQCGAFRDSKEGGIKLVEKYGISENMREVYENGWYKYTVGSFKSYVEAVEFKKSFIERTKLYTAFIVAYKNGQRVMNINDAFR